MSLTPEQRKLREGKIGASFVPYLMAGKEDRIREEWMRLVGHELLVEPNYDEMWNLHYGSLVEPLALDWHEKKTGKKLIRRGEVVFHPDRKFVCCTLDSYREEDRCVIDCKAWSSWQKIDYICSFITPQIIVQKGCTKADNGALLIVHGGTEPAEYPITWGADYEAAVWERIDWFWQCVLDLTPPVTLRDASAPIPTVKVYDMAKSNTWAVEAATFLETQDAAKRFTAASKELRALVPEDAKRVYGAGIEAVRDKANRISLKECTA